MVYVDNVNPMTQTCNELVEPMCSNGITDMFEPVEYTPKSYAENCYQTWHIRPKFGYIEYEYGLDDLRTLTNIIFR